MCSKHRIVQSKTPCYPIQNSVLSNPKRRIDPSKTPLWPIPNTALVRSKCHFDPVKTFFRIHRNPASILINPSLRIFTLWVATVCSPAAMVLQSAAVAAICRYSPHAKGLRPNNSTGGPCRKEATRTPDPYVPNVVRYQLRYFPKHSRGAIPPSAGKSTQLFSSRRTISRFFFRQPPKTPLLSARTIPDAHPGRSWPPPQTRPASGPVIVHAFPHYCQQWAP